MNEEEEEKWLPVVGYEGFYEVSSTGRVRSLDRVRKNSRGSGTHVRRGRILKQSLNSNGYPMVGLTGNDGRWVNKKVHRLIAEAFIPNPDGLPLVRHLNDKRTDNRIENLAWGSHTDNLRDSVRNGTHVHANKTHCPQGHGYSEDNTYFFTRKNGSLGRQCRECVRTHQHTYRRRKSEQPR